MQESYITFVVQTGLCFTFSLGHVGWGISWYINGLLIPVINVVRGRRYTFVVEGGSDPDIPARYHPFYITDDPIGGYQHKTAEEKAVKKDSSCIQNSLKKVVIRLFNLIFPLNEGSEILFV